MNEDAYMDWYNNNFDANAVAFAEKYEELFEDFCLSKFNQLGDDSDDAYDRWRDSQMEDNNEKKVI